MVVRSELRTRIGKLAFDFSSIKKYSIPTDIEKEIVSDFMIRNEISQFSTMKVNDITFVTVEAEPSLHLYEEWTFSFINFGYDPPILEID